jgi:putative transposase
MTQINNEAKGPDTCHTQLHHEEAKSLSHAAKQRLKWMEHFGKYRNARLTCRHFGISPSTLYLWKKRYVSDSLRTLEDDPRTRKPHKVRVSKHKIAQLNTVKLLKNIDSRLGKIRITKILRETGYKISSSTVGRLLKNQKQKNTNA